MSTKTISSAWTSGGDDVYAKPTDSDFTGTGSTWPTSCVTASEIETTNVYQVVVDDAVNYVVYKAVGSPRSIADVQIGVLDGASSVLAAFKADADLGTGAGGMVSNVGKIPRAATAKADGEAVTRSKVGAATSTTLTETLS